MPLLRHVIIPGIELQDPPTRSDERDDDIVMKNLHTLVGVVDFRCGEEVVTRIPNIKKLKVAYEEIDVEGSPHDHYCLDNLGHLHKLESLYFATQPPLVHFGHNIAFPHSLKKLVLQGTEIEWEDMTTKIGFLPFLEVLKLEMFSCIGPHWETVEGQFCSLKYLLIDRCYDLEEWTVTDRTHFPRLELLVLRDLDKLNEIPSCIGDIPTLKVIELLHCSDSAADSAEGILEEQEGFGNDDLRVEVVRRCDSAADSAEGILEEQEEFGNDDLRVEVVPHCD